MKNRFTRVVAIMLVLAMALSMGAFAETTNPTSTKRDFAQEDGQTNTNAEEGWAWDGDTNTLTLTNVNFNTSENSITLPEEANIVLVGSNTIKSENTCIMAKGSLNISGSGSLTLDGKIGIETNDALTIDRVGSLTITATEFGIKSSDTLNVSAGNITIRTEKVGIFAEGNADINVTSSLSVSVTKAEAEDSCAVTSNQSLTINAGTVEISSVATGEYNTPVTASKDIKIDAESIYISASGDNNEILAGRTVYLSGTVKNGTTLNIDAEVEISDNTCLVNNGTIKCVKSGGKVTCKGRLTNNGTIEPETVYDNDEVVYVNGTDILNAQSMTVACGSGSAVYDRRTGTLTLTDAAITGTYEISSGETAGIYTSDTITVVVNGKCTISGGKYGILVDGGADISGQGTLTISGVNYGIYTHGGTKLGCLMNISSTKAAVVLHGSATDAITAVSGFGADGDVTVKSAKYSDNTYCYSYAKDAITVSESGIAGAQTTVNIVSTAHFDFENAQLKTANLQTAISSYDVSEYLKEKNGTYTFTAEGLPKGLTISAAGVISGTPTQLWPESTVIITAQDSSGNKIKGTLPFGGVVGAAVTKKAATIEIKPAEDEKKENVFNVGEDIVKAAKRFAGTYTSCSLIIYTDADNAEIVISGKTLELLGDDLTLTAQINGFEVEFSSSQMADIEKSLDSKDLTVRLKTLGRTDLTLTEKAYLGDSYDKAYVYNLSVFADAQKIQSFTGLTATVIANIGNNSVLDYVFKNLSDGSQMRYDYASGKFTATLDEDGNYALLYEDADSWKIFTMTLTKNSGTTTLCALSRSMG